MNSRRDDDLRPEYSEDLIKSGVRGGYHKRYQAETNIVVIDPDLTKQFPNTESVNEALREYLHTKSQPNE